jgi:hypothetical protein
MYIYLIKKKIISNPNLSYIYIPLYGLNYFFYKKIQKKII